MKKSVFALLLIGLFGTAFTASLPASKELKKILRNWAEVPGGQVEMENIRSTVDGFYMRKAEVSNLDYLEYLKSLSEPELSHALPDTTVWYNDESANAGYVNTYFRNLGFRIFPVVGVSHSQAINYCKWLESEINSQLGGAEQVAVRLPTEAEWIRAARGDNHYAMYTWGRPYAKDRKGKVLANFKVENLKDLKSNRNILTCEVWNFNPNSFGIYQMCGNVAEMTAEKGKVKGGSWETEAEQMQIDKTQIVESASRSVGFRPVLIVKK